MAKILDTAIELSKRIYQAGVKRRAREDEGLGKPYAGSNKIIAALDSLSRGFLSICNVALAVSATLGAADSLFLLAAAPFVVQLGAAAAVAGAAITLTALFGSAALYFCGRAEKDFKAIGKACKSLFGRKGTPVGAALEQSNEPASTLGQKEVSSTFGASAAPAAIQGKTSAPQAVTPQQPK